MTRRAVAHTADTPGGSGGVPRRPLRQLWPISWSMPSALRAVRATIVIPFLFALTFKVIGDAQMTLFAVLAGTVAGFAVGAALLVGIGVSPTVLWVAFPLAVLVAAYTPGAAPFLIGQAAFTVTIVVLFNLLEPTGWRVGLLRVEDARLAARSA